MLVGRDSEREVVERLISDSIAARSGTLLVEGDPGVGKTALLRYAIGRATAMQVVRVTGVETEAELEFSGLLALCRPLLPMFAGLPEPQADALGGVLGLSGDRPRDRFAIGAATLALLAVAAESRPLLVVVDDAHWLDGASTDAICFAVRRLVADRVAVVAAARTGEASAFVAAGFERLFLGDLSREAAAHLVRRAGVEAPSSVVEQLIDLTGGNALCLVEVCGTLSDAQLSGAEELPDPLPVGAEVEQTYASRLVSLAKPARAALVLLAMAGDDDLETVTRALDAAGLDAGALEPAEDAGFVSISPDGATFRHPLMRSAVAQAAKGSERRRAHRALADALSVTGQPERRAWHLAAAAVGPDAEAADALADAAATARARTGYAAAARAYERAARLTPDARLRRERLTESAEVAFAGGNPTLAAAVATRALEGCDDALARARLLRLQGQIQLQIGGQQRARELLLEAAREAETVDPDMVVGTLALAVFSCHFAGRIAESIDLARRGRALAPHDGAQSDDQASYVLGRSLLLAGRYEEGRQLLEPLIVTWLTLAEQPRAMLARTAIALAALERAGEAAEIGSRVEQVARVEGPMALTYALTLVAECSSRSGRWRDVERAVDEGLPLARDVGLDNVAAHLLAARARIAAARGDQATCTECAAAALTVLERSEMTLPVEQVRCTLGLLELGLDRLEEAAVLLERAVTGTTEMGLTDPDVCPVPDLVEALVRLARVDQAQDALSAWMANTPQEAPWVLARAARCAGLLAADDAFEPWFHTSLDSDTGADPFAVARTRLCFGERLRRVGRRVDARPQLRGALETFEQLGATPWIERTRRELRATGEKLGRRSAERGDDLTPQELQIALQVAEGKQNKEVAATLFLSPKTVEFHLGRIYRKLAITTRAQLAHRVATKNLATVE